MIPDAKRCGRCGEVKAAADFCRSSKTPDGLWYYCLKCNGEISKRSNRRVRQKVISAYGGRCNCCGESADVFMSIDHIKNDGAEHRREMGFKNSQSIYRWLIQEGFPPGFQVLCFNCNHGKYLNGGVCPHEQGAPKFASGPVQLPLDGWHVA